MDTHPKASLAACLTQLASWVKAADAEASDRRAAELLASASRALADLACQPSIGSQERRTLREASALASHRAAARLARRANAQAVARILG